MALDWKYNVKGTTVCQLFLINSNTLKRQNSVLVHSPLPLSLLRRGSFSGEKVRKRRGGGGGWGEENGKIKRLGEPFPFSPAPTCFISPLPILQPTGKTER